jgi:hypothetical protein
MMAAIRDCCGANGITGLALNAALSGEADRRFTRLRGRADPG